MPTPNPRTIRLSASDSGISEAAGAFEAFTRECGLVQDEVWQVQVALDEWLTNVVLYAYRGRNDGDVEVTFRFEGGEIEITIVDDGPAFDPHTLPPPDTDAPIEERPIGGLGVYFVRTLMDRTEYKRVAGQNRFTLARRVTPADGSLASGPDPGAAGPDLGDGLAAEAPRKPTKRSRRPRTR